jgi:oxygen-independent coproporphyrinogen-3 oxidase
LTEEPDFQGRSGTGFTARTGCPASVYIHIPFCGAKCAYCDFFSLPVNNFSAGFIENFLESLFAELEVFLETWKPSACPTLYVGGGSPSVLPPRTLLRFLRKVRKPLPSQPEEFTLEANPESLTEEFLCLCREAGVSRLSLGLQTFNPRFLKLLGREAAPEDNHRALKLLDRHWTGERSFDLMYGFPGQKPEEAIEDAREALDHGAGHISAYSLTVEEGTPLFRTIQKGHLPPPNDDTAEDAHLLLSSFLTERGYANYEISNYALAGKECRHNTRYWKLHPYRGIGPAAVSTLPTATGPIRLSGKRSVSASCPPEPDIEIISPQDFLKDYILMGLRTQEGIDTKTFFRIFHLDFYETFSHAVQKNIRFMANNEHRSLYCALTPKGRRLLNPILIDFFEKIDRLAYRGPLDWPLATEQ